MGGQTEYEPNMSLEGTFLTSIGKIFFFFEGHEKGLN
jgi:hypothetical protein